MDAERIGEPDDGWADRNQHQWGIAHIRVAVPDGSGQYEVSTTLTLAGSGETYVTYLDASPDALSGAVGGTYYAVELQNPTFSGGSCQANLVINKVISGTVHTVSYTVAACRSGMVLRVVRTIGSQFVIYIDGVWQLWAVDGDITSGQPGIGARGTPAGNSIARVDLGPLDRVVPNPFNSSAVGISSFADRVDIQSGGVSDDANGTGIATYHIWKNGAWFGVGLTPDFSDRTVGSQTTYTYQIIALDYHLNASTVTFTVTTPPAGSIDPRRVGVRPTGEYWGANPEQIDILSGNVNFSIPLLKAIGRGG